MARRFACSKLVVATHNHGKAGEIRTLLAPVGIEIVSAGELGLPAPEETGKTFEENATLKALAAAQASGLPALADDSGLSVLALDGQPGLHTADWEGPTRDAMVGMRRIQDELAKRGVPDTEVNVWPPSPSGPSGSLVEVWSRLTLPVSMALTLAAFGRSTSSRTEKAVTLLAHSSPAPARMRGVPVGASTRSAIDGGTPPGPSARKGEVLKWAVSTTASAVPAVCAS